MLASLVVVSSMVIGGFAGKAEYIPPVVNQGAIKQCGDQQYYEQAVRPQSASSVTECINYGGAGVPNDCFNINLLTVPWNGAGAAAWQYT